MGIIKPFSTIPEMFFKVTLEFANTERPVLMHKVDGAYKGITFTELRRQVELFAQGLSALGVKRGDKIGIISENRPEWVISDMGILLLGAVDVPIYPTLTAKQIEFIFKDAGVKSAIVSNQFQLNKVNKIFRDVKTLESVILMSEKGDIAEDYVLGFSRVLKMGEEFERVNSNYFERSLSQIKSEDLCTLIYTSGTTGNPKGVMLTHQNFASNISAASQCIPISPDDVLLSFLPLCHSFERMAGYYTAMACGATVAYAESVESVQPNLIEIKPTIVTTVPRLFERIYHRIQKQVDSSSPARRKIFHWAVHVGRQYVQAKKRGHIPLALRTQHLLADKLVFSKFKARTGGRIKFFVSGGAALSRELGEFFEAIGITIIEGYGLSESSPVISVNRRDDYKFGTVGKPIPGIEVKIAEDGEILARGPNIMKGYWNNPKATEEAIDKEGWLHTGDIGMFDPAGFLVITDRKKHLFVSSGGKNIAPQPIENLFCQCKFIDQFILIGDKRTFLSALIVPDFDALQMYAREHSIPYRDPSELAKRPEIYKLFEEQIQSLQKDLATYERVRKFTLLEKPLTIDNGEITPTMKIRRKVVEEKYANLIESMYKGVN